MGQAKKLRTTEWKAQQLRKSIGELCDESTKNFKKAELEKWKNKNKKDSNSQENPDTVSDD